MASGGMECFNVEIVEPARKRAKINHSPNTHVTEPVPKVAFSGTKFVRDEVEWWQMRCV